MKGEKIRVRGITNDQRRGWGFGRMVWELPGRWTSPAACGWARAGGSVSGGDMLFIFWL